MSPQSTSVYSYGPTGMREKAVVTQGGTTKVTESVWEGGRVAAERDSDGTVYRYVYAPDNTPLAVERTPAGAPAELFSYHTDAQGSVVAITNPTGAVVARYRYDAFGAVTSVTGSDPVAERNPLRYRSYYHDSATGLYYLPARYYDPATARFLSPDPAPPSAGDPLSLNRYTYCAGDPVNAYDPTGAVIDVMGDGKLGSEDTITHSYIHTPASSPRKAARRQQMIASVRQAEAAAAAARAAAASAAAERAKQWKDLNFKSCFAGFMKAVGFTAGVIDNQVVESGLVRSVEPLKGYGGFAVGARGPSGSATMGAGHTLGGGRRYLEFTVSCVRVYTVGYCVSEGTKNPFDFSGIYRQLESSEYSGDGWGWPPGASVSYFSVVGGS